ncbi:MAG: hypothetical protein AB9903_20265 [Vulcanimicrobiota bacterium]
MDISLTVFPPGTLGPLYSELPQMAESFTVSYFAAFMMKPFIFDDQYRF